MKIAVTRNSVGMADDCFAPHLSEFEMETDSSLRDLFQTLNRSYPLPTVMKTTTVSLIWASPSDREVDRVPLVVVGTPQYGDARWVANPSMKIDDTRIRVDEDKLIIYIDVFQGTSPSAIVEELMLGRKGKDYLHL